MTDTSTPGSADDAGKTFSAEYVKDLRDEAAKYRTEKAGAVEAAKVDTRAEVIKEYEPQLADKNSEIATLKADLSAATVENLKLKAVLGSEGVDASDVLELVDLVQGDDEESISESTKRVLKFYSKQDKDPKSPPFDPTQGHGGGGAVPLNGDPILNILKAAVGAK